MNSFILKHRADIIGVLSGFDRVMFRGTPRSISYVEGMTLFLASKKILLKDFGDFARKTTERVKEASLAVAHRLRRPIIFLESARARKDELARSIAEKDGIKQGLICVLKATEPMRRFDIRKNRAKKQLELVKRSGRCEYFYHYYLHPVFGFMHIRLETWLPFEVQVWINGREWLSRTLDRRHIAYERRENCFPRLANVERAQRLMDQQTSINWPLALERLRIQVHPLHEQIVAPKHVDYYWSVFQSEWATDVMFRDRRSLSEIYDQLVHQGITRFHCRDVLRFLGRKVPANGNLSPRFTAEVTSDMKQRPEGIRLKHTLGENLVKIYDKHGSVLRVETTINQPNRFKTYRRAEQHRRRSRPKPPKPGYRPARPGLRWRPMRKGVADLKSRTDVSQAINNRYLDALASIEDTTSLGELTRDLCRHTTWKGRRARAMHPWSPDDVQLFRAIAQGDFVATGFCNADLRRELYGDAPVSAAQRRRQSATITRKIRLLRAHGLVAKRPHSHRYVLSDKGNRTASALLAAYHASADSLSKIAA